MSERLQPRNDAFNALTASFFNAKTIIERLARNQPRNEDVADLVLKMRYCAEALSVMRPLLNLGQPVKPRPQGVHRRRKGGKRDWARIKRAQRLRYAEKAAAEVAARMRVDPNDMPRLVVV